jgi:hypothetical protein
MLKERIKSILIVVLPYGVIILYRKFRFALRKRLSGVQKLPLLNDRNPLFIVTLTSYGKRIKKSAPYAIATLLKQTVPPDKIILWLAYDTTVPSTLKKLTRFGLEIKFCDDIKSYKKLIPALKEFPNDVLITVDDDVYYPANWFEKLKEAYVKDPTRIYAFRAHEICLDQNKSIIPYEEWRKDINSIENENRIFPTGVCGILYPPHSLDERCVNHELFSKVAPFGDDIWFWAMAKLKGTKHGLINIGYKYFESIDPWDGGLWIEKNRATGNDNQIRDVMSSFPELIKKII